jgi:hypothetical protein
LYFYPNTSLGITADETEPGRFRASAADRVVTFLQRD